MRMPLFTLLVLITASSTVQAANYATCLLDKLPDVQNHGASVSAVRVCQSKYPGGLASVEQGAGRGLFASYDSGDECTYDKAKDTRYTGAVRVMAEACMRLYNKPQPLQELLLRPVRLERHDERLAFLDHVAEVVDLVIALHHDLVQAAGEQAPFRICQAARQFLCVGRQRL